MHPQTTVTATSVPRPRRKARPIANPANASDATTRTLKVANSLGSGPAWAELAIPAATNPQPIAVLVITPIQLGGFEGPGGVS